MERGTQMNQNPEHNNHDEFNEFGKEFWEWLSSEKTQGNEAWWLKGWLEDALKEYKQMDVHSCGCRQTTKGDTWSATKNYILYTDTRCKKCDAPLKRTDYRMELIKRFRAGEIPPKHDAILRHELEL